MNYSFIPDKCYVPIDLVFALDASGSVETSGFRQIKDFVKDIVNGFDIGVKDTHVGVLTFSEIGEVQIGLTDAFDKATLFDKIDNLNYPGYRTNTNDALEVGFSFSPTFLSTPSCYLETPILNHFSKHLCPFCS